MSTADLRMSIAQLLNGINDDSVLQAVYTLLSKSTASQDSNWYNSLSKEDKALIEVGIQQADNGELIPNDEVMREVDKLLGRA